MNARPYQPLKSLHENWSRIGQTGWPWQLLIVVALIDMAMLAQSRFALAPGSGRFYLLQLLQTVIGLMLAARFERFSRIQTAFTGFAFLAFAWPALRLFNHLSAAANLPLADAKLAAIDKALGFDWFAYLAWADTQPWLLQAMSWTYSGLTGFVCVVFLFLLLQDKSEQRCRELANIFVLTALFSMIVGALIPAVGAMGFYAPTQLNLNYIDTSVGTYAQNHFFSLRTNLHHTVDPLVMPGLVTFPSFHTAMGVIAIYCARARFATLLPAIVFNTTMIASTPIFGSHYLIDVIFGVLTASFVIWSYRRQNNPLMAPMTSSGSMPLSSRLTSRAT